MEKVADTLEYIMDPRNQDRIAASEQENRAFLQRPRYSTHACYLIANKIKANSLQNKIF